MRVVAFNGSARRHGNTSTLIEAVFEPMREVGVECEEVPLSGRSLRGCIACYKCFEAKDGRCHGPEDDMNTMLEHVEKADGIIIASPTYFADVSAETKALIDRVGMTGRANPEMLRRKPGAAVVAVRRAGAIHTFDTINHFFLIAEMVIPGSSYWNIGYGRERGEVENDEEGMRTMRQLGDNMAWLLGLIGAQAT